MGGCSLDEWRMPQTLCTLYCADAAALSPFALVWASWVRLPSPRGPGVVILFAPGALARFRDPGLSQAGPARNVQQRRWGLGDLV
eukprot:193018-Pyramimonas_sp.AAC.1